MFLTASQALVKGLKFLRYDDLAIAKLSKNAWVKRFKAHFGSGPLDLAEQWYDLCQGSCNIKLPKEDKSERGFRCFLHAHYWLFTKPKNRFISMSNFGLTEKEVSGKTLWCWIARIAALKEKKIVWHKDLDKRNGPKIILSVDGVDFKTWEPSSSHFNRDPSWCSSKMKASAYRYELAIDVWSSKLVWINGPFKAGSNNDLKIFKSKLMGKIPKGKKVIADRGYGGVLQVCIPSTRDPPHVRKFSSRVRCRHETFNGRIKKFSSMDQTWTHGVEKHKMALEAVCVTMQYQMDNGSTLFDP